MLMSMETWEHFSRLKVFPGKYRVAGDVSLPPPTDKLFMSIRIDCLIHEYFPDYYYYYYTEHLEHSERGSFELHPNTLLLSDTSTMSRILSSAGIPTDYHPQLLPQIIFQAKMAMISSTTYYCNNIYDVPWITVVVLFGKLIRPPNDEYYYDEEEEIRRATEESLMTMMDIDTFKPGPASKSSIEALEKARFVQGLDYSSVLEAEEQCMICLEKLIINSSSLAAAALKVEVEQVTRMPCLHLYHADCIVRWLETSNLCPVCRFQMPTS